MKHAFFDSCADLDTPLHKINARVKIIALFIFLFAVVLTPIRQVALFIGYTLIVATLFYLSGVPLKLLLAKLVEILPFIALIAIPALFRKSGYLLFLNCIAKAVLAVSLVLIISFTTKFTELLGALRQLRFPRLLVDLLSFMYRYSFLLEDQILRVRRAYESRSAGDAKARFKVRVLSNILGTVFIRTYERAERVYLAMCARGYAHEKSR